MVVHIDENDLKQGVLGLVLALVEIIRDALRLQALRRMESGSLSEQEIERLGEALMELDVAIETIKVELGVAEAVTTIRDGLDQAVSSLLDSIVQPGQPEASADGGRTKGVGDVPGITA